jgi:hypothetical protein
MSSNHPAVPASILTDGTNFSPGILGVDGTPVTLLSALTHDVHFVRLRIVGVGFANTDSNAVGDLLIDPAGGTSWQPLIEDLTCGFTGSPSPQGVSGGSNYEFPLYIPAGASIGWQAKLHASPAITISRVLIEVFGEPTRPELWWCGRGVETLGVSDSRGTGVVPGNGSFGSWISVGSPSTKHYRSMQLGVNGSDDISAVVHYRFELGHGSGPIPGAGAYVFSMNLFEIAWRSCPGMIPCNVKSGTQMQVRGFGSAAGETIYVGVYGVY